MENLKSYLTFKIGDEYFAANASFVHNIIEIPKITQLPEMPEFMLGVINLRGAVLPVIDSRLKFGIKAKEITANTCIIVMQVILEKKDVLVGFLVDAVDEVIEFDGDAIKAPPSLGKHVENSFITGVYDYKEKFVLIIDMNKVISNNEILSMKILQTELPG